MFDDLHINHEADSSISPYHCPVCGKNANYRQKRCCVVWCPDTVIMYRELEAERLKLQGGGGI